LTKNQQHHQPSVAYTRRDAASSLSLVELVLLLLTCLQDSKNPVSSEKEGIWQQSSFSLNDIDDN
jgi:outer membrane biogenesis lipoprotein LolB